MTQRVLIVDDEAAVLDVLTVWLGSAGYDTYTAKNGLEGLLEINKHSPDLVVADIIMPQIDGFELCRLMREISLVPFMFFTGLAEDSSVKKGFSVGADDYLTKPTTSQVFLDHVSSLLSSARATSPATIHVLRPNVHKAEGTHDG